MRFRGPHPRPPYVRKTIKWGGAALTVLLVLVWIGSGWYGLRWWARSSSTTWAFCEGRIRLRCIDWSSRVPNDYGFDAWRSVRFRLDWWFESDPTAPDSLGAVPLWFVVAFVAVPTALAFRLDTLARHRERMNLCKHCGYDRTGLAGEAVCPECGSGSNGGSPA